jgi:hypothetical protein
MTRPWKHPKTSVYWLRKRVPEDLLEALGKTEVKKSLRTKNPAEAKALLIKALSELETQWANLRRGPTVLNDSEAHQLAAVVYEQWLNRFKDNPSDQRSWNVEIGPAAVWSLPNDTVPAHLIASHEHMYGMQPYFRDWADELLAQAGLKVDQKSRDRLARAVSAAIHRASITLKRLEFGEPLGLTMVNPTPVNSVAASSPVRPIKLKQLVDEWILERRPAKKTIYEWTRVIGELTKFIGHDDANQITTSDLNRWKAHLLTEGRRPKTIRDAKFAPVRAILQCAVANERIPSNPAERVVIEVKSKPSERIRGYPRVREAWTARRSWRHRRARKCPAPSASKSGFGNVARILGRLGPPCGSIHAQRMSRLPIESYRHSHAPHGRRSRSQAQRVDP